MRHLHVDLETYSSEDIKTAGLYRYVEAVDFEIMLLGFSYGREVQVIDLTIPGAEIPQQLRADLTDPEVIKHAHNAAFERLALAAVGIHSEIDQWRCSMIKAAYCGLPMSLAEVSEALEFPASKMTEGKALIKYFCSPCAPTKTNGHRFRNLPKHSPDKWATFVEYCRRDVVVEKNVSLRLDNYVIPGWEFDNYVLDQKINDRGVLFDLAFAANAVDFDRRHLERVHSELKQLTGVENPNSPAQLKRWLSASTGESIQSLAKDAVGPLIEKFGAGSVVGKVLTLRQQGSKTSAKKYQTMPVCAGWDARGRGLFQFYGASRTGRWAGRLVQLHNLPRNYLKPLHWARELVASGLYEIAELNYPIGRLVSELIRTALVPAPGNTFLVADFSAIEARVIAWLAGEEWRLEVFNGHGKIYEASASMMFGVPIDTIGKGSDLRAKGKVAELALGYQGGVGALRTMGGESMGLTGPDMREIVTKWRGANKRICALWKSVEACAKRAMRTGKTVQSKGGRLRYHFNGDALRVKLPSGRCLFYWGAKFGEGRFGEVIKYKGRHPKTYKWTYLETYGGKLTENIVQAIARDLLAFSLKELDRAGFYLVGHVHDEAIAEEPAELAEQRLQQMCQIMSVGPEWAQGLPLAADGFTAEYYKKD